MLFIHRLYILELLGPSPRCSGPSPARVQRHPITIHPKFYVILLVIFNRLLGSTSVARNVEVGGPT